LSLPLLCPTASISPLSLHDALPIFAALPYSQYTYVEATFNQKSETWLQCHVNMYRFFGGSTVRLVCDNLKTGVIHHPKEGDIILDRKSTRLNSSHVSISYAVFCLKK